MKKGKNKMIIKNKRQILTIVLSVLLSVFLVAGVVFAITTIGTGIDTAGKVVIGTEAGANALALTGTDPDQALQTHAQIATTVATGAYAGNYTTTTVSATQSNDVSAFGSWSELYLEGVTLTGSSNYGATWGNLDISGTTNLGGGTAGEYLVFSGGLIGTVWTSGTLTIPAGRDLAGVIAESHMGATTTNNGQISGFLVHRETGSTAWQVGLRIPDSAATTGIDIGVATTGINFSGAMTTGINVANNLVIPQLLTVGSSGNGIHWAGQTSNILIYAEDLDTTPASATFAKIQLNAATSAASTSGRLETFRAVVSSSGAEGADETIGASMRALVGQTEFAGLITDTSTFTGTHPNGAYGMIASMWSNSIVAATGDVAPLAIYLGFNGVGSAFTGESSYIYIYNYGKVAPESIIQLYNAATPSAPTYFLDMLGGSLGSSSGPFTTDSVATSSGNSDGCIKVRVGSAVYEIPIFAQ